MGSRARIGGQPINQFLVIVPLGLFATAFLFDFGTLLSGWAFFGEVGYWDLTAALITALLAIAAGLLDLRTFGLDLRRSRELTSVRRAAASYGVLTAAMLFLFGLAWWD